MNNESRTKNSIRNISYSLIITITTILLSGVIRFFFVRNFIIEYLGLNSLFTNIISLLSITESGFGVAISYAMYKPMAEGNVDKVRQLLRFLKKMYMYVAIIVLICGCCIIPLLPFIVKEYASLDINFYIIYGLFLCNTIFSFFVAYRRSLFHCSQRADIEQKINFVATIIGNAMQLLCILVLKNYYLFVVCSLLQTVVSMILIICVTNHKYKEYLIDSPQQLDNQTRYGIKKNVFALLSHKIGGAILNGTDSILISMFVGLAILGKYSNYLLIVTALSKMLSIIVSSVQGSIGNVIATKSVEDSYNIYKRINFLYLWVVSFCTIGLFTLVNPFIECVFGQEYVLDIYIVILIAVQFYLQYIRSVLYAFKECCGLFWQNRFMPIIESMINLVSSIVLGKFIGLPGIILGTIFSNLLMPFWVEPKVLYKYYFNKNVGSHFKTIIINILITCSISCICYFIINLITINNIIALSIKFIICIIVSNLLIIIAYSPTKDLRDALLKAKGILQKLLISNKSKVKRK